MVVGNPLNVGLSENCGKIFFCRKTFVYLVLKKPFGNIQAQSGNNFFYFAVIVFFKF